MPTKMVADYVPGCVVLYTLSTKCAIARGSVSVEGRPHLETRLLAAAVQNICLRSDRPYLPSDVCGKRIS